MMREWTKSFVFCNTSATTYSQFTEVLTNGLLSRNISLIRVTVYMRDNWWQWQWCRKTQSSTWQFCLSSECKVEEQTGSKPYSLCCQARQFTKASEICLTPAYVTGTQNMLVTTCYTVRYSGDVNLLIWLCWLNEMPHCYKNGSPQKPFRLTFYWFFNDSLWFYFLCKPWSKDILWQC